MDNIGRLDVNTTGLILLQIMVTWQIKSCTHHLILKGDIVTVDKPLGKKDISSLEKGVPINDNSIGRLIILFILLIILIR